LKIYLTTLVLALCWILLLSCGDPLPPEVKSAYHDLPETVDFNFHVKPILSDRCYNCHGPDQNARQADLRLDTEDGAFKALASGGHAFAPGNIRKSQVLARITSDDPQFMMPPPESNLSLNDREKAMIAKWVKQGAQWKGHWAFQSPDKPEIPTITADGNLINNPIDNFILKKLQSQGLTPSGQASKEAWLRRVTMDLTGLPPTPDEWKAFMNDHSEQAHERVVDRLLDSPHYGERMALEWLDLARYADTHGYQDDGLRNTWPWRDWIIEAFNKNIPYDRFLLWQLAGDLLPNPTKEQLVATCFNRNHPQTQEGGVVDEEYRVEYVADRTNTLGKAFMGLTTECARCHDHKYDPLTQKEYYALYAFFNNNFDTGIVPYNGEASPTLLLPSKEAELKLRSLDHKIDSVSELLVADRYMQKLKAWLPQLPANSTTSIHTKVGLVGDFDFESEKKIDDRALPLQQDPPSNNNKKYTPNYAYVNLANGKLGAKVWGDVDSRPLQVPGKYGKGLKFRGDAGIRFHKSLDFDRYHPFSVTIWMKLEKEGESGPVFNKTNGDFEGYRGWLCKLNEDGTLSFQFNHVWPNNSIDIKTTEKIQAGEWYHIGMTYDGSSTAEGLGIYVNGKTPGHEVLSDNLYKSLLHGVNGSNWSYLPTLIGRENLKSSRDLVLDEFKVFNRELTKSEVQAIYGNEALPLDQLDPPEKLQYYLLTRRDPTYNGQLQVLTNLRQQHNQLITDQPEIMIMKENPNPRATFVLDRGAYDAPQEQVEPDIPAIFPSMPDSLPKNRLGLAYWLTQKNHPLTSRVIVNRLWSQCFGKGLVATQEDFGNQGNLPTHPELLDWLAVDLMENGWDLKKFMKQLVLSATYGRSSTPENNTKQLDADNLFYAYYPAHRLPAELIRDQALAASGLLVRTIGGPSVYPYQPEGIWKALATRNATEYVQQHGDSLYRRSMYTIWKRSSPPPAMTNFDAPDRYYCVVRRQNTSTPLQSLVMMNDPQFMEAARIMAERMIKEGGDQLQSQIRFAFLSLIGREVREHELLKLSELYQLELKEFRHQPDRVKAWLSSGEYPGDASLDQALVAAHTTITATIMNFEEFTIMR